ncbi:membrane protein [Mycoplasma feriruminatoris]|uniref:aromatic motif membrane protein n=1 Tax=Mycoplasma feriruminatoris TaxID=1179777 RepID=UPI00241D801E|nr:aromatic motif membrane protein [Mycoplasma feriruminatoris]WFQ96379.1 membrane protein [Mycoplasma feriruminatoris]
MKRNNKKLLIHISIFFGILPFVILPSLLITSKNKQDDYVFKPVSGFNINISVDDVKSSQTKEMINVLLGTSFKNNLAELDKFSKSQTEEKSTKELFKKAKELTKAYKDKQDQTNLKNLFDFYSTNWLFLINNISKFEYKPLDFWKLEPTEKHSKEFLDKTKKENLPKNNFKFQDNYFNKYTLGEESKHGSNNVYYLRKDKLIFRLLVSKNDTKVIIDKIILFNESEHNTISLDLISNILHAIIHKDEVHATFEKEIVGEYNLPLLGIFLLGENNEKE